MRGNWIWIGYDGGGKLQQYMKFEAALVCAPDEKERLLKRFNGPDREAGDGLDVAFSIPVWSKEEE
jgi:hypothetical protein